jgi:hypothetical protein
VLACFGPGFERLQTHVRTPRIAPARRCSSSTEVTELDPRRALEARLPARRAGRVTPDDWFFQGHFKNDPCMPGTLMFEGCLQAMAFYLGGDGLHLRRDGWRFEPVTGHEIPMRCRGQVTPTSAAARVRGLRRGGRVDGPVPTLYADLLCTVDGLKAFHARRVGLRLVPDWPSTTGAHARSPADAPAAAMDLRRSRRLRRAQAVAVVDGFRFDYASLVACAWGRPSEAFGPMYSASTAPARSRACPGRPTTS